MKLPIEHLFAVSAVALVLLGPAPLNAGIVVPSTLVPSGVNPGEEFHLVFVTSGAKDAIDTRISEYNSFVWNHALQYGPPGIYNNISIRWTAIASTATVSARDNTGTNPGDASPSGLPIYGMGPTMAKIADNYDDFWDGSLDAPIYYAEAGDFRLGTRATGTNTDGTSHPTEHLGGPGGSVRFGTPGSVNFAWVDFARGARFLERPFYAISATRISIRA